MIVLAIDTALDACSAAVLDTETSALLASESLPMQRGHAEALMPLIDRVMSATGLAYTALDRVAVTVGPGSFTGLRVGLSAARGIALAADRPVVGLTTLSAFAAPLVSPDATGPIISAIDARHDHLYFQVVRGDGEMLIAPRVAPIDDATEALRFGAPRIVGNAAQSLAARWPKNAPRPLDVDQQAAPDIGWVAWLGAAANPDKARATPFYLRPPDARPQTAALPNAPA